MKRFIAYILLALTVFLGIGATFVPVATELNADLSFKDGVKFTYQLVNRANDEDDIANDDNAAKDMASTMEKRLQNWGVSDYKIETIGNDMIDVTLAAQSKTEYDYIKEYLAFNADFSIGTSDDDETFSRYSNDETIYPLSIGEAYIAYTGVVPVLVIPVVNQTEMQVIVDHGIELESASEEDEGGVDAPAGRIKRANEGSTTNSIIIWNNRVEGEDLYEDRSTNPNVADKIFLELSASNIYYAESENGNSAIQVPFTPSTTSTDGSVSVSAVTQAYNQAIFKLNCWNAGTTKYQCDFLFENPVAATSENLLVYGNRVSVAMSQLFIATLICLGITSLILVLFYRVAAIGMIASTSATTFLTFLFFVLFNVQFNIAAVIGLVLVAGTSLFSGILYQNRFHEEIYKGRNFKKANKEASKRVTPINIDVAVITALIGLFTFLFGGNTVSSLGVILIIGAIASLVVELLIHRSSMWLLTNTTALQTKYSWFNIDATKVPDILKEEKSTYVAPYENSNPTKHKKVVGIGALVLMVASLAGVIVFSSLNGSMYNKATNANTSEIVLVVDAKNSTIDSVKYVKDTYLANIKDSNGEALKYTNVTLNERSIYNEDIEEEVEYNYYVVTLNNQYEESSLFTYTIGSTTSSQMSLESVIESYTNALDTTAVGSYKFISSYNVESGNISMIIGAAVALAVASVYVGIRYRISRGVATFSIGLANGLVTLGFFTLTRIPVTDIVTTAIFGSVVLTVLAVLFILSKEKEYLKEEKTRSVTIREETLAKALKIAIYPIVIFTLSVVYIAINFFGFASQTSAYLFFGLLLAMLFATILILVLFAPLSDFFDKIFSNIKLPKINHKNKKTTKKKNSSSEPQEAIFIGIND